MPHLNLTVDQALSTTRAVRKRLDLTRPVEREVIEECIALAQQAPNGGNYQNMHFVAVTDPAQRLAMANLYRRIFASFESHAASRNAAYGERVGSSVDYLNEHLHEVPVLLIPCHNLPRPREANIPFHWSNLMGDAHMATWSFMLAARERGIGAAMTTLHLIREEEAAEILGIDYSRVMQTSLIPVAYTIGTDFRPVERKPLSEVLHWDRW